MSLGVVAANKPAKALYEGLGFVRAGSYHMRVKE
jgi:ribosomal protein S18 acetylase RimI-like enzyme